MKAIIFDQVGRPDEVLQYKDVSIPIPEKDQILVEVKATTVNPADFMFISGSYRKKPQFPQIAGMDGSGVVLESNHCTSFPVGSRIYFRCPGAWAQKIVVSAGDAYLLPPEISFEVGAQLALNIPTAFALTSEAETWGKGYIALTAGDSFISGLIVQIANQKNIKTIRLVRSPANSSGIQDHVVSYSTVGEAIEKVASFTGNEGLIGALDAVGGELGSQLARLLRPNGHLLIYGLLASEHFDLHGRDFIKNSISVSGFGIDLWIANQSQENLLKMRNEMHTLLIKGQLLIPALHNLTVDEFYYLLKTNALPNLKGNKFNICPV